MSTIEPRVISIAGSFKSWRPIAGSEIGSIHETTQVNEDGSTYVFIGPEAPQGRETNWIKSAAGRAWFPYFRFYGPTARFFHQSWDLPQIEKVDSADFAKT